MIVFYTIKSQRSVKTSPDHCFPSNSEFLLRNGKKLSEHSLGLRECKMHVIKLKHHNVFDRMHERQ